VQGLSCVERPRHTLASRNMATKKDAKKYYA
jgi:hypothetical protein